MPTPDFGFVPDTQSSSSPLKSSGVDFVPDSNSTPALPSGPGTLQSVGKFLQPIVNQASSVAEIPTQVLANSVGKPDPFEQGIPHITGPSIPIVDAMNMPSPEGFLRKAGNALSLATLAVSPELRGLKLIGTAGLSGLGNSVGEGNPAGQVVKDTIFSTMFGSALALAGHFSGFLGESEKVKTGVVGKVYQQIANTPEDLIKHYVTSTIAHTNDVAKPPPDIIAADALKARANILFDRVIPEAGQAVGEAKKAARTLPIAIQDEAGNIAVSGKEAAQQVIQDIGQKVESMTGHIFGKVRGSELDYVQRSTPAVLPASGSNIELTTSQISKLEKLQGYVEALQDNPTAGFASDMVKNIDQIIGKAWDNPKSAAKDPVITAAKYARGAINRIISPAAPELAKANEAFSHLQDLAAQIGTEAGKKLQSASLAERRLMSGDKWNYPFLTELSQVTQPFIKAREAASNPILQGDLVQHAIVSDWAKMNYGDATTKTMMRQHFMREVDGATSFLGYPKQWVRSLARGAMGAMSPDPYQYALSVARGNPQSMEPLGRAFDSFVDSLEGKNVVSSFAKQFKGMGLSAKHAEEAALPLVKAFFFKQLTQPQTQNQQPQPSIPADVSQQPLQPQEQSAAPGRTLSVAQPTTQAINNVAPATSGQQFSSQARQLSDFGMNMQSSRGLALS